MASSSEKPAEETTQFLGYSSQDELEGTGGKVRYTKIRDAVAGGLSTFSAELYFHSFIEKQEAEKLLGHAGDFLVRQVFSYENTSKSPLDNKYIIMFVNEQNVTEEVKIRYSRTHQCYYVNEFCFTNPGGLIAYHRTYGVSVKRFENKFIRKPIAKEKWEIFHEQIQRIKTLGAGNFGQVFLAHMRVGLITRQKVAVKILGDKNENDEEFIKEVQMMRENRFDHPNVVHFLAAACYHKPIMLIMEYCDGGSLEDRVKEPKEGSTPKFPRPSLGEITHWITRAAAGLNFLHGKNLVHRDIAARNVLVDHKNEAKISDFGLTVKQQSEKGFQVQKLTQCPWKYLSPEVFQAKTYTLKSDVYAFGMLMWEAYNKGVQPFNEFDIGAGEHQKLAVKKWRLSEGPDFPPVMWLLCQYCWHHDPEKRPTMDQVSKIAEAQYRTTVAFWQQRFFGRRAEYEMCEMKNWQSVWPNLPPPPKFNFITKESLEKYRKKKEGAAAKTQAP